MLKFIKQIFIWWQDATIGTLLYTKLKGKKVGQDGQGNTYYQTSDGKRRWVIYNGVVEASRVPAEWHGWLHKTVAEPPTVKPPKVKPWERPHQANLTGTGGAYFPPGSLTREGKRDPATGDYEAWKP
jgi:NADH:ubiquinone oxidoreductase subunit